MAKKALKVVSIDERGRITLPKEIRKDADSFVIELQNNGVVRLIPEKSVSLAEAKMIESLKRSVTEFKKGKTKEIPEKWIDRG